MPLELVWTRMPGPALPEMMLRAAVSSTVLLTCVSKPLKGPCSGMSTSSPAFAEGAPLTAAQFRMAKAALGLSNPDVARLTGLHRNTLNKADRGVGLNDFNANSSGAVAVFQDDVPLNSPALQLGTLFDKSERVTALARHIAAALAWLADCSARSRADRIASSRCCITRVIGRRIRRSMMTVSSMTKRMTQKTEMSGST